jgi:glycosyltransferase involved in cell wall biosynthesis
MRVVQVVQGFPPESLGGTETYAAQISAALYARGHEVRVFTRSNDTRRAEFSIDTVTRDGLPITRVNNTFRRLENFTQSYDNPEISGRFAAFLDAVTPDIVHIHHLMYLSTGCVQEATRRGIPVVMTLHDYWLICQRGRFLKPDLSLCPGQTDDGCARCFAYLLAGKLTPVYQRFKPVPGTYLWARDLLRWAHAKYAAVRPAPPQARAQINQRMQHIRELCQHVSLFLAPSRFLREQFIAFGIPPEKIIFSQCGLPPLVENDHEIHGCHSDARGNPSFRASEQGRARPGIQSPPLDSGFRRNDDRPLSGGITETPRSQIDSSRRLIFGYIGVVDPVKGIHHLVEAFEPLANAELRIYGGETDYAPYPDRGEFLAQLRRSPHIRMMGRYEHQELGRILGEIDVVVVPSIWYENAPLVIREAFLAKKPVVTAALGGMPEWIQEGVNGLLFRPRDVTDLRRTLERFISDPALVEKLSRQFPKVQSIVADAEAIEGHYRSLIEKRR